MIYYRVYNYGLIAVKPEQIISKGKKAFVVKWEPSDARVHHLPKESFYTSFDEAKIEVRRRLHSQLRQAQTRVSAIQGCIDTLESLTEDTFTGGFTTGL